MELVVESSNHVTSSCHPAFLSSYHAVVNTSCSLALGSRVDFRTKVSRGGPALGEEAREDRLDKGSENDLGAARLGKGHPQDKDEFESIVESCEVLAVAHISRADNSYGTSKRR
jgi:hypothetical protein